MDLGLADCIPELIPFLATKRNLEIISQAGDIVIARRMVEIIHESSQRATNVVSAFRSYVSPEREESKLVDIPRDISQVLIPLHNMLKHGIKVQTILPSGDGSLGSSDKLSQVWMNLIRNGAQAMEFNGVLEIRTEMHGESAVVSVTDNGPGIPADIQDKIFEPFFTTKKQGEGMGLGLDICKRIVEMHHGRISFESRPGRTEFIVVLPSAAS
jgi:signal transduction histidine kinase